MNFKFMTVWIGMIFAVLILSTVYANSQQAPSGGQGEEQVLGHDVPADP
jgi:hypothetical protein